MNEHEQEVADLHEANKHVRDHAFLQGQLIQQLECKLVAAEAVAAELRTQLKGCVADLNSTIEERCRLSDELASVRAHNANLAKHNVEMTEHATKLQIKYDATARERDELLKRLDVPTPEAKIIYVTTAAEKAYEKTVKQQMGEVQP